MSFWKALTTILCSSLAFAVWTSLPVSAQDVAAAPIWRRHADLGEMLGLALGFWLFFSGIVLLFYKAWANGIKAIVIGLVILVFAIAIPGLAIMYFQANESSVARDTILSIGLLILNTVLYLAELFPTVIAFTKQLPNRKEILIWNLAGMVITLVLWVSIIKALKPQKAIENAG